MCIIIYKPRGIPLPTENILENCKLNNPDGIGFMYRNEKDEVIISKGFASVQKLLQNLRGLDEFPICIHFRWATHGAVIGGNCHPFPISRSVSDMQRHQNVCNMGLAHNGIIPDFPVSTKISDTMQFILSLPNLEDEIVEKLIGTDGKFVLMTGDANYIFGKFIEFGDGCFYSNDGYLPPAITELDCRDCSLYTPERWGKDGCPTCNDWSEYLDDMEDDADEDFDLCPECTHFNPKTNECSSGKEPVECVKNDYKYFDTGEDECPDEFTREEMCSS